MTKEEEKILARTESLILWNELSKTGGKKDPTIRNLFHHGVLHKPSYFCDCPFCDIYLTNDCLECPWPGNKKSVARCLLNDSPYTNWQLSRKGGRKKNARKVFNLIYYRTMK